MSDEQIKAYYKILDQVKIKYKDKYNTIKDTILNDNEHNKIYDKLRVLFLISFYQKIRYSIEAKTNYILEKTFLDKFYYKEINDLLLDRMKKIEITAISNEPIDIILDESNFYKLEVIGKAISSKTDKSYYEEIIVNKKKINIYKELVFVKEDLLELFKYIFGINIDKVEYVDKIKIAPNMIFVGNLDKDYKYNLKYILEFNDEKTLKNQQLLFNKGFDDYI